MTTGKTIALTMPTFVSKIMSLLFHTLSGFVIAFLPRSKCLLISWLQSPSAVILEPKKRKSVIVSLVSLSICHEVIGPDAVILVFWMLSHSVVSSSLWPPWTVARQAPLSREFSRQEYWSGVAVPSSGGSSWSRVRTWVSCVSCIGKPILYHWRCPGSPRRGRRW